MQFFRYIAFTSAIILLYSVPLSAQTPTASTKAASKNSRKNSANRVNQSSKKIELYKSKHGPLTPISKDISIKDVKRKKDIPIRVTFPKEEGKYPLIVFSHGMFGSGKMYGPLTEYWVSHGYVVIQPTHGDSLDLMSAEEKQKNLSSFGRPKRSRTFDAFKHFATRPVDISVTLDSLDTIEKKVKGLKKKIDRNTIGMGGHSFGAHTTLCIGGMELPTFLNRSGRQFSDKRPKALLAISPPGNKRTIGNKNQFKKIERPCLAITGTKDNSPVNGSSYKNRIQVFEKLLKGKKYLLLIKGAEHSFGGITGNIRRARAAQANEKHVAMVRTTSLAFWDYYLKDDAKAAKYLTASAIESATQKAAQLSRE